MPLSGFHPLIAEWFHAQVGQPTDVQVQAWPAIQSGTDVLIAAPTGSGKTFAAFLSCIDHLFKQALACELDDHTQVLYVSPLKALSNDIQKNLQQPLAEIGTAALSAGLLMPELRVLVRTGDTPMTERQQMLKWPPHILVTTPELSCRVRVCSRCQRTSWSFVTGSWCEPFWDGRPRTGRTSRCHS